MSAHIKHLLTISCPLGPLARRLGLAGVLFFLLKGLLWLTLPGILIMWGQ
jgi:hypothetical protein